jgi:hypothetical protein
MKRYLSDLEFDQLVNRIRMFFVANAEKYGFNMTWFTAVFLPLLMKWIEVFGIYSDPSKQTHGAVKAKDEAREDLQPVFSQMVRMIQDAPDVTDAQLVDLTIPRPKPKTNKPLPAPPIPPDIQLRTPAPGVVEVHAYNAANQKYGKPAGGKVCVAAYVIRPVSEPAPTTQEELTQSVVISAGKVSIRRPRSERAHILYASGHWVNATGDTSPWSDIVSVAIP